ncbi:putative Homeobox protein PKNOX2 [Operophtera brumata]|uniref:Putative Homeobox protein PKNOX2 n=1 Tax=Operophtera brumata TaxID=104452 RepID=A0A0L7K3C7_OPEBR|nr:putative Homeobox protein PKNOX2 [Operophtera brumata]
MQGAAPPADADQAYSSRLTSEPSTSKHPSIALFPDASTETATAGAEPPAADAFGADLQAFVQHQRRDTRPLLLDEPEIDGLMIKSIQVSDSCGVSLVLSRSLCRTMWSPAPAQRHPPLAAG